jgi:hypothetical protein
MIPVGFNNNIVWNVGHIISVQQLIAYGLSDQPYKLDQDFIMRYRKNTKPEGTITVDEFSEICKIAIDTIVAFEKDYTAGVFSSFKPFIAKTLDVTYNTIEEVIPFIHFHDCIHVTTIRNYLRIIR